MEEYITENELKAVKEAYRKDTKQTVLRHALSSLSMDKVVSSKDVPENSNFTFSVDIPTLPACNQKRSGRCWIFSASTVLREIINKKLNVKDQFEISQNFIAYYDKLEKYNYYMENVLRLILSGEEKHSRKLDFLLGPGVGDGGQWDMYVNLVKKYGIVPKAAFPETAQSEETRFSSALANAALRKFTAEAYRRKGEGVEALHALKTEYMEKIYSLFTSCFGVPPETFDFEYTDKGGKYHLLKGLTPKSFFDEYVGWEIDEYVSLIHAPTEDKSYNQTYHIELVGNVLDGKEITHLNLSFERLEELIIAQLQAGEIVWFGSDVSYYGERTTGLWDDQSFDYETAFGLDLEFDKAEMLDFSNSMMNHAMVLTGVDLKDGKPVRWKIENSWGNDVGNKGYYIMSESFFRHFVYQAAIKRKYLNEKEIEALNKAAITLAPWDPFGTLAD